MTTAPAWRCSDALAVGEAGTSAVPRHSSRADIQTVRVSNCLSPTRGRVPETLCTPSSHCPDWRVEVGERLRHDACKQVFHDRPPGSISRWSLVSSSQVDHTRLATPLVRFPLVTPPALEASPQCPRPFFPILLKPFPCLCTSCAGLTPDLWRAPGPSETESEPGACSQTSSQRCWCTPAAG